MVQNYRDLLVWQKAMHLAEDVFKITEQYPSSQRYVLAAQMQRCALSVPSNIAEGRSRHSEKDFIYHINIARGSLAELETQILLSERLTFIDELTAEALLKRATEITKMLFGLRTSLDTNNAA
jgi:four helix bundle protein